MTWSEIAVLVVAVLMVALVVVWRAATRLDRLHRKVVASRIALDAQLLRRASAAQTLALSGELDPASALALADAASEAIGEADEASGGRELLVAVPDLADSVHHGRAPGRAIGQALGDGLDDERAQAESNLSQVLRAVLDDPEDMADLVEDVPELLDAVAASWYRVQLARRFHNEAVAQAQRMRRKPLVRTIRLAGHAAMPTMVDLDDAWPRSLGRPTDRRAATSA